MKIEEALSFVKDVTLSKENYIKLVEAQQDNWLLVKFIRTNNLTDKFIEFKAKEDE